MIDFAASDVLIRHFASNPQGLICVALGAIPEKMVKGFSTLKWVEQ